MAEAADTSSLKDALSPRSRLDSPTKHQAQPHNAVQAQLKLEDDDLALARILQEQERAFYLLQRGGQVYEGEYEGASAEEALAVDEGVVDHDNAEGGPIDDAELARRLQQEEQMDAFRRMYAAQGIDMDHLDQEVAEANIEGLGYEDLSTLGEVAGHVSKGLPAHDIARLPTASFKQLQQEGHACATDKCCICQLEYEADDTLTHLPCKHVHHSGCLATWLGINKVCPVCHTELTPTSAAADAEHVSQ